MVPNFFGFNLAATDLSSLAVSYRGLPHKEFSFKSNIKTINICLVLLTGTLTRKEGVSDGRASSLFKVSSLYLIYFFIQPIAYIKMM